jgi:hypothetical protein
VLVGTLNHQLEDEGWVSMDETRMSSGEYPGELLFTDGLPELDDEHGYRGHVAAGAAGISYRQLDYWARTGLVEPTVRTASGSGSQRLYGFRDSWTPEFHCSRFVLPSNSCARAASMTSPRPR